MNKRPDFIIIGAMKCATSSLHEQLANQPGIFMSELKEPNFFSNDEQYNQGIEWYLSLFAQADPDSLCGESSTHYTKLPTYPHTVERLHKHLPDVKLIYVMRHPIDRLISQYIHEWSMNVLSVEINQAIAQFPEMVEYSCYSQQLQPYLETFGKEKILPVFFQRLLNEPQAELERICRFIGYPQSPSWVANLEAQNPAQDRWRRTPLREFIVNNPVLTQLRRWLIPKAWREQVRKSWTLQNKPQLAPQLYSQLEARFDQDLACLGSWLGIELSCANFKSITRAAARDWVES